MMLRDGWRATDGASWQPKVSAAFEGRFATAPRGGRQTVSAATGGLARQHKLHPRRFPQS